MNAYERVCLSRAKGRATAKSFIEEIFTDFYEMHGDRLFGDDPAVIAGIARLGGRTVTVIGTEKGSTTDEKVRRNFGSAHPEGYRKALRAMKQAEKFHRPVICFVDTSGAYCDIESEERGQGSAIAVNLMEMMALKTPVITVMIGEGGSGGALALAVANRVWMLKNAYYSVISPEGAASIIWKDAGKVAEACAALKMTAEDLYELKVIERIFDEDEKMFMNIKKQLCAAFDEYEKMPDESILQERYDKFRRMGRAEI